MGRCGDGALRTVERSLSVTGVTGGRVNQERLGSVPSYRMQFKYSKPRISRIVCGLRNILRHIRKYDTGEDAYKDDRTDQGNLYTIIRLRLIRCLLYCQSTAIYIA